ncbi:peptide chain release factor N(5)-glutamine methyltransferase, partial [Streptococcus danieliae]|nr:peptide chain release factor N(5)-glutamine methyltransferase [Streptococcus danieliae]
MKRRQALEKACFLLREQAKEESIAKFLLQYILDENSGKFNYNMDAELEKE